MKITRNTELTKEQLKKVLKYDPLVGVFTWVKNGKIAGSITSFGYRRVKVGDSTYSTHRLAWLWVNGYFPEHDIDHINRNKDDNRIANLRHVTRTCNQRNVGKRKDNDSGVRGVHFDSVAKKWKAQIRANGKKGYLGYYSSFDDAVCARLAGEQCLGWLGCDISSSAYRYVQKHIIKK